MNNEIVDRLAQRIASNFEKPQPPSGNLLVTNPGMGAHASLKEAAKRVANGSGQEFIDLSSVSDRNVGRSGVAFLEVSADDLVSALDDGTHLKLLNEFSNAVLVIDFKGASRTAKNVGIAFAAERKFGSVDIGSVSLFISEIPAEVERMGAVFSNPKYKINPDFILVNPNLQDRLSAALVGRRKDPEVEPAAKTPKM